MKDRVMPQQLAYKHGLEKTIELILQIDKKPVLIGVYGEKDAGKSYLINQLRKMLQGNSGTIRCEREAIERVLCSGIDYSYVFVHGIDSEAQVDSQRLGSTPDLRVFIYNPKLNTPLERYGEDYFDRFNLII